MNKYRITYHDREGLTSRFTLYGEDIKEAGSKFTALGDGLTLDGIEIVRHSPSTQQTQLTSDAL